MPATPLNPGDGSYKLTGTAGDSNGRTMWVEIDGTVLTAFHRKYDWTNPPGAFVNRDEPTDTITFLSDDTGVASLTSGGTVTGHSFDWEPRDP